MTLVVLITVLAIVAQLAHALPSSPAESQSSFTGAKANGSIQMENVSVSATPDEFVMIALDTLNKIRTGNGLKPVCISAKLQNAAQAHSDFMAKSQIFEHSKFGFAENIAVTPSPSSRFDKACFGPGPREVKDLRSSADFTTNCLWFSSPGHNRNMLTPGHTRVGIAYAEGPFRGPKGFWWTQTFDSGNEPCIAGGGSNPAPPVKQPEPPKPTTTTTSGRVPTIPSSSAIPTISIAPPARSSQPPVTTTPAVTELPQPTSTTSSQDLDFPTLSLSMTLTTATATASATTLTSDASAAPTETPISPPKRRTVTVTTTVTTTQSCDPLPTTPAGPEVTPPSLDDPSRPPSPVQPVPVTPPTQVVDKDGSGKNKKKNKCRKRKQTVSLKSE